jgi:glyoxylase-like metal-dependent hydrolase (beta-lactamase superfamily II)
VASRPGHVCQFRPEDRVLLAGDALATVDAESFSGMLSRKQKMSRPAMPITSDWDAAKWSVKEMATLRARVLARGHGEPVAGPTVAEELATFAENFATPERGRYVGEPARFDELGVAWLPPAPLDPLPKAAAVLGITLLGGRPPLPGSWRPSDVASGRRSAPSQLMINWLRSTSTKTLTLA